MTRVVLWTVLTVFFVSLFQATILTNISFLPAIPDIVLLVVLYVSFTNTSMTGSTIGFISGLLMDFLSAAPIGYNAMTKAITGFISGRFSGSFNMNKVILPVCLAFAGTFLKVLITAVLTVFFKKGIIPYDLLSSEFWLELIVNMACAPLVFGVLGLFPSLFTVDSRVAE